MLDFHSGDVGSIPTVDSGSFIDWIVIFEIAVWRSGWAQLSYKEKVGSSNLSIATFCFLQDYIWLGSSMEEQSAVNRQVEGSNPSRAAKTF